MATIWERFTAKEKRAWKAWYEGRFGKKFIVPNRDKHGVSCEVNIEPLEEIAKFMAEVPNPTRRE